MVQEEKPIVVRIPGKPPAIESVPTMAAPDAALLETRIKRLAQDAINVANKRDLPFPKADDVSGKKPEELTGELKAIIAADPATNGPAIRKLIISGTESLSTPSDYQPARDGLLNLLGLPSANAESPTMQAPDAALLETRVKRLALDVINVANHRDSPFPKADEVSGKTTESLTGELKAIIAADPATNGPGLRKLIMNEPEALSTPSDYHPARDKLLELLGLPAANAAAADISIPAQAKKPAVRIHLPGEASSSEAAVAALRPRSIDYPAPKRHSPDSEEAAPAEGQATEVQPPQKPWYKRILRR